jgi:hypothetical protein
MWKRRLPTTHGPGNPAPLENGIRRVEPFVPSAPEKSNGSGLEQSFVPNRNLLTYMHNFTTPCHQPGKNPHVSISAGLPQIILPYDGRWHMICVA